MSWPPYSAGARMHTSDAPPTRKSISALGDVNPVGPHHCVTYAGALQAFHSSSTGASKTRVMMMSNVWVLSFVSLPCTLTNPFLSANLTRERPARDVDERTGDGAGLLGGQERRRGRNFGQLRRAARHPHLVQVLDQALEGCFVSELAVDRGELLPRERLGESGRPDAHYAHATGPISAARLRTKVSVAASAGPVLPIMGLPLADPLSSARMTPDPCSTMPRAAARAVTKLLRRPLITARKRSSVVMSISGIPCTSPRVMRLKDTSMLPACETTACSSRASSTATSAAPPSALMSLATVSSDSRVRPTRKTRAPSRENS